ncbi:MAG: zinc ribbon domain-containing protein [Chloroflexi bacterium]|nr:MAG: zinc ribbon domain-containing protein [Chloroflexota bacterium]
MRCPNCQTINPPTAKFCLECGRRFGVCPNCGTVNVPTAKYCIECGTALLPKETDEHTFVNMAVQLRNISVTRSWRCLECRSRTRTILTALYERPSTCRRLLRALMSSGWLKIQRQHVSRCVSASTRVRSLLPVTLKITEAIFLSRVTRSTSPRGYNQLLPLTPSL